MRNTTVILNYHKILSEERTELDSKFEIDLEEFKKQILYLVHQKFNFILPDQIGDEDTLQQSNVILTFDDGNLSDFHEVAPFLKALQIPAIFFVNTSLSKLKPDMMKEMLAMGFIIGSHGVHHDPLSWLTEKEQFVEIQSSKWKLEHSLDTKVEYFAFPHGDYNSKLLKMCQMVGYKNVFTTRFKRVKSPQFKLHRLTIKNSLSFNQFKSIMNNSLYSHYLSWLAVPKKFILKLIGHKKANALNSKLAKN